MKTSLILYRVADFLRQHPPFQSIRIEELLPLARSGRVAFHTEEEYLFEAGRAVKPQFWLLQQGSVELLAGTAEEPEIRDLAAAGDLLGLESLSGVPTYPLTARTASECIVYVLDPAPLEELRRRHAELDRYLAAALGEPAATAASAAWLDAEPEALLLASTRFGRCAPGTPVREVSRGGVTAVLEEDGAMVGLVTPASLLGAVAGDRLNPATPAEAVIEPDLPRLPAGARLESCVLAMARSGASAVALTANGDPRSPLAGIVTETDVELLTGCNPMLPLRAMRTATSLAALRLAATRTLQFAATGFRDTAAADWFCEYLSLFWNTLLGRVVELEGGPIEGCCWILMGRAGRGEHLTPVIPPIGAICEERALAAATAFLPRLEGMLRACGLEPGPVAAAEIRTIEDWKSRFRALLGNPLLEGIYQHRTLFDFRPAAGHAALAGALRAHCRSLLAANGTAAALLGNDCLERFPPLTFFGNVVVDAGGVRREQLDLDAAAVTPLADVGRVFALAAGDLDPGSTIERFTAAAVRYPGHAALLREAADAFRVLLLVLCRNGNRDRDDGARIHPGVLSRYEQILLKSVFRTTARLLEFTHAHALHLWTR